MCAPVTLACWRARARRDLAAPSTQTPRNAPQNNNNNNIRPKAFNGTVPLLAGLTLPEFVTLNVRLTAVKAVGVLIGQYS